MFARPIWLNRLQEAWRAVPIAWLAGVRRSGKTTLALSLGAEQTRYVNRDRSKMRRASSAGAVERTVRLRWREPATKAVAWRPSQALLVASKPVPCYREWMDSFFARDIQRLFEFRDLNRFSALLEYLLHQSGGLLDVTKAASGVGISRPKVDSHLRALFPQKAASNSSVHRACRPISNKRATWKSKSAMHPAS